jgi:transcriptional regulator with XRE-family HTH domain
MEKSKIGENIKRLRLKANMSQDALSKKSNLAFYTISKIESGSTPDQELIHSKKIADALGVSLNDLTE